MGIRGLQTYMENELGDRVCNRVAVKDAVSSFKRRYSCSEALILIDGNSTFTTLYNNSNVDWICGGQYRDHERDVLKFVDSI